MILPLLIWSVAGHTLLMPLLTLLGAVAILLGILGLAGIIGTTLGVEIALFVVGFVLIAIDNRGRLNL